MAGKMKLSLTIIFTFCAAMSLMAKGQQDKAKEENQQEGSISVASTVDVESVILGNIIRLVLEEAGFDVIDKTGMGSIYTLRNALGNAEIDIYPEYTGNGNWFFSPNNYEEDWYHREGALAAVQNLDKAVFDAEWLEPAPVNNTWGIAVRRDMATNEALDNLYDFAEHVNEGGRIMLACSEEFVNNPDLLQVFQEAYGFELSSDQLLILNDGNTALAARAASLSTGGANVAMVRDTDAYLTSLGLLVLENDKTLHPIYEPAPRIRSAVLQEYPEVRDLLNPVFKALTLKIFQTMNSRVVLEDIPAIEVAREWLFSQGFITLGT